VEFSLRPVEDEKLQLILEASRAAPYEIYVASEAGAREALSRAAPGVAGAPLLLVFCAHPTRSAGLALYPVQDANIGCTFAMLAASAQGLAATWVGDFDESAVRAAVGAPPEMLPIAILPIGYAAG